MGCSTAIRNYYPTGRSGLVKIGQFSAISALPSHLHCPQTRMDRMRHPDVITSEPDTPEHWHLDPLVVGTLCGILSAIGYTAANICLRAVTHCDPVWVSAVKSVPTVVLVGPWIFVLMARSQALVSSGRVFAALCAAGLLGQLAGNVAFQWSLGVVGMAMAVPLCLGTMIIGGTIIGRWMLGEEVTRRTVVASAVLILSICVLSFGAGEAHRALHTEATGTPLLMFAGVAAACLCGVAYAVLGAVIRYSAAAGTPVSTILVTIGLVWYGHTWRYQRSTIRHRSALEYLVV